METAYKRRNGRHFAGLLDDHSVDKQASLNGVAGRPEMQLGGKAAHQDTITFLRQSFDRHSYTPYRGADCFDADGNADCCEPSLSLHTAAVGVVPWSRVGLADLSDNAPDEGPHNLLKICNQAKYLGTTADISR